jgi:N-acetylglucosamine malate deacetylase 1
MADSASEPSAAPASSSASASSASSSASGQKAGTWKKPVVLAVGCHPDDIEFMMAGTLFHLKERGAEIHYMNVANGNCGSREYDRDTLEAVRREEARQAAAYLGATWHPSIANDLEVTYDLELVRKVASVIRQTVPDIILTLALHDYMEDHMNTARITVTAAFTIAMPNFSVIPPAETTVKHVALYHALPYGLHDQLMNRVRPQFFVDTTEVLENKRTMLSKHTSQRSWLDESQKIDSYLQRLGEQDREVGEMSGVFTFAEGWSRHNPLGYSDGKFMPLEELLDDLTAQSRSRSHSRS